MAGDWEMEGSGVERGDGEGGEAEGGWADVVRLLVREVGEGMGKGWAG